MKPFIEAGDIVSVISAVDDKGGEQYTITGIVISWPSPATPHRPRVISVGDSNIVEIGQFIAVWRNKHGND